LSGCDWRVRLPEGEEFGGIFKISAKEARAEITGENLAPVHARHEEAEAAAIVGEAYAALRENAELEGTGMQFRPAADQSRGRCRKPLLCASESEAEP
jgi:hypothetical protein